MFLSLSPSLTLSLKNKNIKYLKKQRKGICINLSGAAHNKLCSNNLGELAFWDPLTSFSHDKTKQTKRRQTRKLSVFGNLIRQCDTWTSHKHCPLVFRHERQVQVQLLQQRKDLPWKNTNHSSISNSRRTMK